MKYYKGYITSRDCFGTYFPQRIQNIVIRDFCSKKNFTYELSAAEYTMKNSYLVLNEMIEDIKRLDGIVAFSMFQLPVNKQDRIGILKKILKKKKIIYFVLERLEVKNSNDIINLNEIWSIKFSTFNSKIPKNLK